MFRKAALAVSAILCTASMSYAQLPCGADAHYQKLLKKYPQLAAYEQQFDEQVARKVAERTTLVVDTNTYDIPLVVHVIHDYGAEDVSDNALYEAAAYWATIYMKQNPDTADVITPFIPYVGNPKIRLHLATIDPNGKPTKGIVRFQSYLTMTADDQAKFNQWNPQNYVNIWLINTFGASEVGAAAYAILPATVAFEPQSDGIICLYSYTDNTTKTIPHEMGHVLNLQHPWGNTNNPDVACGDDHVDDTPPTKGHNPVGCAASALYDTTCATGYHKTYTSVLTGMMDSVVDYPDTVNSQNIMDYTYCQKMFSKGQAARMRTSLTGTTAGRNHLYAPANLTATGALLPMPDLAPTPDYIVSNRSLGSGSGNETRQFFMTVNNPNSFQFKNFSWNDTVSSVLWTFSNGATTPTSTSMTSVNNTFSVPGWVTVSLAATSNAGTDTLVNTQAVYAADPNAIAGSGYSQSFASADAISNWPMFNYYNNQFQWQFYTGAGLGDNTCVRYHSFDSSQRFTGNAIGDHDDMYTPAFNLTGYTGGNLYLDFFTSGARTMKNLSAMSDILKDDSLQIDVSQNGGQQWAKLVAFKGSDLANNGTLNTDFVPGVSSTAWVSRTINIPDALRGASTFFRFRFRPGNTGNNLYMDNFSISQFPAGVKEVLKTSNSFDVYPNPANNGCTLIFRTGNDGNVSYCIKDVTGKVVYQATKTFTANSIEQELVPRSVTPAAGMYFVTVTIDGANMTQKLVVY